MVSQALIQAKANFGYAKAAQKAGSTCQHYRAQDTTAPIASGNLVGVVQALFDTNANLKQAQPSRYGKLEDWFAGLNQSLVAVGDYLVEPALGTFFIASLEFFRPARTVRCNRVIQLFRPSDPDPAPGAYSGNSDGNGTMMFSGWPVAIQQGTKGEKGVANLPGDTRAPWVEILLPAVPGVTILVNDVISTDLNLDQPTGIGERYIVSGTELTSQGWRLTAAYSGT